MLAFIMIIYWNAAPILQEEFATQSECEIATNELLFKEAVAPRLFRLPDGDYGIFTAECRAVQKI
jgi:hypothetical protein